MPNHERVSINRGPTSMFPRGEFINRVPEALLPEHASAEAPKDDGSGMITSVPWESGDEPKAEPMAHPQAYVSGTNRRSAPVLGLPPEMSVQEAHVLAEQQNAARHAAQGGPEQQQ